MLMVGVRIRTRVHSCRIGAEPIIGFETVMSLSIISVLIMNSAVLCIDTMNKWSAPGLSTTILILKITLISIALHAILIRRYR